ncbi:hypothetical protein FKW77_005218 [Venturia effusa]|uniref:MAGE domain-containing protein n=1 Tax=Venturia effusa TaxID=50376 RepID=A0A517LDQ0_9PEZI|nr:hypothetical protein FKW77_005218 [Venturia effusa]
MPRLVKRARRRLDSDDEEEEEGEPADTQRRHAQTTQRLTQRRRSTPPEEEEEEEGYGNDDGAGRRNTHAEKIEKRARKLVRYALACSFSRTSIRRTDVVKRVMDDEGRDFKLVFAVAQSRLQMTFGMEMRALPGKEKVSVRERRVEAAKTAKQAAKTADVWTLVTTLPTEYRDALIIPAPDPTYISLYTFVISVIVLSGGTLDEARVLRYMRRARAEEDTPLGTTEKLLQRMNKDGYIVKIKDDEGGEERFDYMVGPLGKVEVDRKAIADIIRKLWAGSDEELERKIERTLNLGAENGRAGRVVNGNATNGHANGVAEASGTQRRKSGRRRQAEEEEEDEEEDDDQEEESD